MKLTFLLTLFCVFQATAVISQTKVANINIKNASLEQFFSTIEQQTSIKFLYRYENIEGKSVSVNMVDVSIDELLDATLPNEGLSYMHMKNNLIVISSVNKERVITGTVTDESGVSLPGVNIIIKGTTTGVVTDFNGNYSISVPEKNNILQFTFIGFIMKDVVIGDRLIINVQMQEDIKSLEEVVVTALGLERKKRSLAFATQQVKMDAITTVKDISLGNSLAGKVAGVSVTTSSGASGVGGGSRIIIRGERSINGNNTPLIVVDGVTSNVGLDAINPDDVESINVLKGPGASALYGSNAANGVIVVTTKKGKKGETKIEVSSLSSFDIPYLYPEFQNVYGQGSEGEYKPNIEVSSWGPKMNGQIVTDWTDKEVSLDPQPNNISDFFKTGYNYTNTLSYSTGTERSTSYFSYSNLTAGGVLEVNKMQRHNFNLRLNTELVKNLNMDFNITWLKTIYENGPVTGDDLFSPMHQLIRMPRSMRTSDIKAGSYIDETGSLKQLTWLPESTLFSNPYWSMYGREKESNSSSINALVALKYDFTSWLYLQLRGRMARSSNDSEEKKYWDTQYVNSGMGYYGRNFDRSEAKNADLLLGFNKDIIKDLNITANFGAEIKDAKGVSLSSKSGKLMVENKFALNYGETPETNDTEYHTQTQSLYGTFQLGYNNYLFLDLTARNDWNSTLPYPHSYFYPSIGLTGVISEILTLPEFVSFAKLRGSYAQVGNGAGFAQIYQDYRREADGPVGIVYPSSGKVATKLIPEKTKSWEAGAEIRLLKDRLGFDFTFYKSNTFNQLVWVTSAPSSGYGSAAINCGNVQNNGVELMITAVPVKTQNFRWDINLNFTRNKNKVIELTETLDRYRIGAPNLSVGDSWIIVGKPFGEILSKGWVRNDAGEVIVDEMGLPKITPDSEVYLGNFNYDWRSGITSNFSYKNWNMYFLIDLNYGGVRQSATEAQMAYSGTSIATLEGRDGFIYPGVKEVINDDNSKSYVPNDIEITSQLYNELIGGRASSGCGEAFNHDATNSRLRELSIGYTVPLNSNLVKDIKISAVGRNLFYIYNECGWFDPDVTYDLGPNGQGSESAFLPGTRNIGFNIKLIL